jgi:NAD(P)-dependent dehydrogenase (short-subunit alcohol dehydrogenase family)
MICSAAGEEGDVNQVHFDFSGARVLVTGGSGGIGLGIARAFREAGARVAITGRRARASDYDADLGGFEYHPLEVRQAEGIARVAASLGALDVLVNNAGENYPFDPSEWDPEVFERSVAVNLVSAFRMCVACRPILAASRLAGGSSVINVASMAAFRAVTHVPGYGAAKAGIVQMTRNLAVAWVGDRIRVNAVAPGLVESGMTAAMRGMPELERVELAKCPMGRWGTPEDLAPAFLFLASSAAGFLTGHTLCIDGGYSAA